MKTSLKIFAKLTISLALILFAYKSIDINDLKKTIGQLDIMLVLGALLIKFFCLAIQALRWNLILVELEVVLSFIAALKNILIGFFFNQTLPSSIGGDAVRAWECRHLGIKKVIASIVLDRVAGLFALFLSSSVFTFVLLKNTVFDVSMISSLQFLMVINLLGMMIILILPIIDKILKIIGFSWLSEKLEIHLLTYTMREIISKPVKVLVIISSSISLHLLLGISGYILLLSINSGPSFLVFFPYFLLALTISTIPISIGGWGVRETAMMSVFYFIGIDAEVALVFSILYGLLMFCVGFPGGILWLFKTKLN